MKEQRSHDETAEQASIQYLIDTFEEARLNKYRFYEEMDLTDCRLDFEHPFISLNPNYLSHPHNMLLDMLCLPKRCGTLRVPNLRGMFNRPKCPDRLSLRQHRLMVIAYLLECKYTGEYHVRDTPTNSKKNVLMRYRSLNPATNKYNFHWDKRYFPTDTLELSLGIFSVKTRIIGR